MMFSIRLSGRVSSVLRDFRFCKLQELDGGKVLVRAAKRVGRHVCNAARSLKLDRDSKLDGVGGMARNCRTDVIHFTSLHFSWSI